MSHIKDNNQGPCEICGRLVGHLGHRCQTGMCYGTYLRAKRILAAGVDAEGTSIDEGRTPLRPYVEWSAGAESLRGRFNKP